MPTFLGITLIAFSFVRILPGDPVLLMAGERTPPIHAEIFRNVCAAMPQAERVLINGAGHGTSRDNPAAFNAHVLDFLDRHAHPFAHPHSTACA